MYESDDDIYYECLTPPQTPSPQPTKKFYLPLSTLSIYCRENGSSKSSNKRSVLPQDGPLSNPNNSATIDKAFSPTYPSYLSSVVKSSTPSHMTGPEAAPPVDPTTPPSTPPTSHARFSNTYHNSGMNSFPKSSPTIETPPLSPSASVSTTQSVSEPPTPIRNGSIESRGSTSTPSTTSPETSDPIELDNLASGLSNAQHSDITRLPTPPTPATPTSNPARKTRNRQNLASKKKTTAPARKSKVPKFIPEPGPFIPEGLHLVDYPAAHSIIVPDTLEAGHIIGYGLYPVQPKALQIAREKCRIMRNKLCHYGMDGGVKDFRSFGLVSRESETSVEKGLGEEKEKEMKMRIL
ncbi:hypothetical protein BKA61DRAFT_687382 [Leptodontidium sp. MPI-SDFR-AT-0119]|nr:hypothetical protein BKA61DRAFT_687382 [Leptodontidium sp. MPI-SDFR-AT-0119]